MPNFFYFDQSHQKYGPVSDQQLKALAAQGVINPNTPMETDTGHKGLAGQIPGLFVAPPPVPRPTVPSVTPHDTVEKDLRDYIECDSDEEADSFFNTRRASRFEAWKSAAEGGNPAGQVLLGCCGDYDDAAEEAVKWYRKAAEQGHAEGQFSLALCYNNGHGIPQDSTEAEKWFRKAAEQGHGGAAYALSELVQVEEQQVVHSGRANKSRMVAALLALLLGHLGIHWFYLEDRETGLWHLKLFAGGLGFFFPGLMLCSLIGVSDSVITNIFAMVPVIMCLGFALLFIGLASIGALIHAFRFFTMTDEEFYAIDFSNSSSQSATS